MIAAPIDHGDDRQRTVKPEFFVDQLGDLGRGKSVTVGNRIETNKGQVASLDEVSFNQLTSDRIRPIENDELDVITSTGFHPMGHRPNIGVVARANVLNVKDERIEAVEHFFRWNPGRAVEAVHWKTGDRIATVRDFD